MNTDLAACSVKPEVDLDADLHGDRLAVLLGGIEFPAAHGFDGFLIETHSQGAPHTDLARAAICADDYPQNHRPLVLGSAGRLRVVRIGIIEYLWGQDTAADVVNTAADA